VTYEQLEELNKALWTLRQYIDDDANVPQRFTNTLAGALSDSDSMALGQAATVAHRLMLWRKFPQVSRESYFAGSLALVEGEAS